MRLPTEMLLAAGCALASVYGAEVSATSAAPVLVELFTSEGCSSCPPADALLEKMDASSPASGVQLIVLSEHVDYWNGGGWKDPYSSTLLTERQSAYCRALGVSDPYTPQIIIDGSGELKTRDAEQFTRIFQKAAAAQKIPIRIASVKLEDKNPPVVNGRIETDANSEKQNADVYVAIALDHAESQVLGGENSGRRLKYVAVLESFKKVGRLERGKSFAQSFEMKLKPGVDPANIRIIAFVQESGPGKVLGAALQRPPIR